MQSFWQDIRHGVRLLARSPGFAAVTILMLGLGVGSATAIFALVESILLRPLPYPDSQRIVRLSEVDEGGAHLGVSLANYEDWSARANAFEAIAAMSNDSTTMVTSRRNERISAVRFHGELLRVFGRRLAYGRAIATGEIMTGSPVAVIRQGLAARIWGNAEEAVGKTIVLQNVGLTIVGVLETIPNDRHDVFVPAAAFGRDTSARNDRMWDVVARLRADAALPAASNEMQAVAQRLRAEHGAHTAGVAVTSLLDDTVRTTRPALLALLAGAGFLILIACANIANLLYARALGRRREMAVRQALGASRGRVIRQLVVENLPLAVLSAVAGITIATWSFSSLLTMIPFSIPRRAEISVDAYALLFGLLVSLAAGVFFSIAPALHMPVRRFTTQLDNASRGSSTRDSATRHVLVAAQFALALALLSCAGLLTKSVLRLAQVDAGFDHARALVAETELPATAYGSRAELHAFWRNVVERVTALPGVEAVGVAESAPLDGSYPHGVFELLDQPGREVSVWYGVATEGFFRALKIPLVQGRLFDERESRAAVINRLAADTFWPGQNPIGRRVRWRGSVEEGDSREPLTIVGVIGDIRHASLIVDPVPEIYGQFSESPSRMRDADLVVRAAAPGALTASVRGELNAIDAALPVRFHTLGETYGESLAQPRFLAMLIGFFAVSALLLSAAGLYSSMAYAVSQRAREIGIRLALGGPPDAVRRDVLWAAMRIAVLGIIMGALLAAAGGHLIANQLFGVPARDPVVFVAAALSLAVTALLAADIPARRASRADPVEALRE